MRLYIFKGKIAPKNAFSISAFEYLFVLVRTSTGSFFTPNVYKPDEYNVYSDCVGKTVNKSYWISLYFSPSFLIVNAGLDAFSNNFLSSFSCLIGSSSTLRLSEL